MVVISLENLIWSLPRPVDQLIKKGIRGSTSIEDILFASDKFSSHSGSEFNRTPLFAASLALAFQTVAIFTQTRRSA